MATAFIGWPRKWPQLSESHTWSSDAGGGKVSDGWMLSAASAGGDVTSVGNWAEKSCWLAVGSSGSKVRGGTSVFTWLYGGENSFCCLLNKRKIYKGWM